MKTFLFFMLSAVALMGQELPKPIRKLVLVWSLFIHGVCAAQSIPIKQGVQVDTLYMKLMIGPQVSPAQGHYLKEITSQSVNKYNLTTKKKKFYIQMTDTVPTRNSLEIFVDSVEMAKKSEQRGAFWGSMIGLTVVPVATLGLTSAFMVAFWFQATNKNYVRMRASPNIRGSKTEFVHMRLNSAGGWFRSEEGNIEKNNAFLSSAAKQLTRTLKDKIK